MSWKLRESGTAIGFFIVYIIVGVIIVVILLNK